MMKWYNWIGGLMLIIALVIVFTSPKIIVSVLIFVIGLLLLFLQLDYPELTLEEIDE